MEFGTLSRLPANDLRHRLVAGTVPCFSDVALASSKIEKVIAPMTVEHVDASPVFLHHLFQ